MKYFKLPKTDLTVSRIALGCMRIADKSVEEVAKLVETALNLGINFFDHADIYGGGKSEELFGEVLKQHPEYRKKMVIQTKCGIVPGKRYDFSKEHIISSVEQSLKRLNCDYIDILLLHRPDALANYQEVAAAFDELYESKKVRYFGVSNHTPLQIELLQKYSKYPIIINQLQLSIVHSVMIDSGLNMNMKEAWAQDKDGGVLDYCRLHDITIQPWSVLQASWAEGTFIDNPDYAKLNEKLDELAQEYQVNKTAIAIAWLLRHPAIMQPIVGTTSPKHLQETVAAIDVELTRQQWYDLYLASGKPLP
ncbi:aldo/keto reductase family oxidoreductase [uncultured Thomasclavelia sp.]|uniref:aldo/keto reductase n=1 Tax=uncultured Thomasclavelia sp. TaxID=3025759 RepID=UPI0025F261FE|nr:aldo/keto reductase [uncultured Thomasclavelia sp.]